MAQSQRWPRRPRTAESHVGDRELPDLGARRTRRALRGLRPHARRLQLLPQPPLPEVSGGGGRQWLAEREAELLPVPYYHVVFTLPASIGALAFHNKAVVYDLLFKTAAETLHHDRRRPQASWRAHRPHRRAAHLGLGADPPSARPRHRSRRRPVAGRLALDRLQARLLPARARAVASVPPPLSRRPRSAARGRPPGLLRRSRRRSPTKAPSTRRSPRCDGPNGWSTPSGRSPDPKRCWPISPATPTASPSPTPG